jgi:hypothetical protein
MWFIAVSSILTHWSSCFCASTMLFLFLWLCSIDWSQVLWYLQPCIFSSELLWLQVVFCFHMYFRTDFSISVKDIIGILIGIALTRILLLVVMTIFTMLILPIHSMEIASSSNVFFNLSLTYSFHWKGLCCTSLNLFKVTLLLLRL